MNWYREKCGSGLRSLFAECGDALLHIGSLVSIAEHFMRQPCAGRHAGGVVQQLFVRAMAAQRTTNF